MVLGKWESALMRWLLADLHCEICHGRMGDKQICISPSLEIAHEECWERRRKRRLEEEFRDCIL